MAIDPSAWGVVPGFHDVVGAWHPASEATVQAVLKAMGAYDGGPVEGPDSRPQRSASAVTTVRLDHPLPPLPEGELRLEDGGVLRVGGALPPDLPAGYHTLLPNDEAPRRFVVSPGRCPEPPGPPRWGWAAQLYAARSSSSWGIGDLADLAGLARWSARLGAGMVLANPLHAPLPGAIQEASPYYPSSRCFISPLYLRIEEIPGADTLPDLDGLAAAGRALNAVRLIDRNAAWELKSAALERIFDGFTGDPEFDVFVAERGPTLAGFARFCALVEMHGNNWRAWPDGLSHPDSPEVARFADSHEGGRRVAYHAWLQWHLDRQLAAADAELPLVSDMALGSSGGGADAWLWQDCMALGAAAGAPPDLFNLAGQDWGLPPWDPWKVRAAAYEPFIQTLRACFRRAGGLRLDHVMGLFRLYWVPAGCTPA
ncbi:MAG: 4-alpha-glucanotransferase, partial [Acidimicrobiales bacterium]